MCFDCLSDRQIGSRTRIEIISHDIFCFNFTLLLHKTPNAMRFFVKALAKAVISTGSEIVRPLVGFRGQVCGIDTNRGIA